ncbi:MAG: radical SAM protein [Saccharofermentanales bacterium]|jgi:MoaA/NifB/PqqE/SkfB family radical SAM enzyme
MSDYTFNEKMRVAAVQPMLEMLDSDPERNIPRIIEFVQKLDRNDTIESQINQIKDAIEEKGNWYDLTMSAWTDIDDRQRRILLNNFVVNGNIIANNRAKEIRKEHGCNVPWTILMDPTSACNLKCIGCWAADYGDKMSMSLETLDDIIQQGKELGIYFYIYSGGEPMVRKNDIITLCERHQDCVFLAFTNGTLIDEDFCKEMVRVSNFVPAISVEGFEEATDARRGKGTFARLSHAMDLLREHKMAFGVSCCYTRANTDVIGSEAYFDWMVEKGAKFAWFFTYMPVGVNASPDLMVTPEQREFMYHQVRKFRDTKPIFTMDFWNDGEYVNGCIAGGRCYMHINANGDIEPCAFIHYSDSNVHDTTILEALKRPLFKAYQAGQPFNDNMLRPCPLLDNKNRLAEMVEASGAKSTDLEHPEDVRDLCGKCAEAADRWAPVADNLWSQGHWVAHNPRGFVDNE